MSADRPVVLVTDGEQRAALAVTRSLGAAGFRVVVAAGSRASLAGVSRFAWKRCRTPPATDDAAGYREAVRAAIRHHRVRLVVPVTEAAMLALLPAGPELDGAVIAGPSPDAFERIRDKAELLRVAIECGIAVPEQVRLDRAADLPASGIESFPVVIKPARSLAATATGRYQKFEVSHAANVAELHQRLREIPDFAYPVLVQRYIDGPGIGMFALLREGRPLALFAHRRIREKPPSGGVSVCCESVDADPALVCASIELLTRFGWDGPAMVEYKVDRVTGRPYLMEVNGRFWGSLQLAIHAGVDFPRILAEACLGADVEPVDSWGVGIRNHWEWGEVDAALIRVRRAAGGRRRAAGAVLREILDLKPGRDRTEVFRLSDPLPFVIETARWLKGG